MKLVVFAHTPPPLHGQSYMVQLMVEGLGGNSRGSPKPRRESELDEIQCFHVDTRFSNDLADIGAFQIQKIPRLIRYCLEAIWCRFRYGADIFYFIPAPPKRVAVYRDWVVLLICRPFFRRLVFHWEASGLAEWLEGNAFAWERAISQRLLGQPDLSITVADALSKDAVYLRSKQICVVPNGIPDPCPAFDLSILPKRSALAAQRREIIEGKTGAEAQTKYRIIFLAHCTREKGLFDALAATALANRQLREQSFPIRLHLSVAGAFLCEAERREFEKWQVEHRDEADYVGFLTGDAKTRLMQESDCLCFPTYYSAEAQPISIIEAMAFGLAIVASAWRGIPELLPRNYPLLVAARNIPEITRALIESMKTDLAGQLRQHYCEGFTEKSYSYHIASALRRSCVAAD